MTVGVLAVGGVAVVGCGGGSPMPRVAATAANTTAAGASVATATTASGLLAYSSCMRAHGVPDFPDPGVNGIGKAQVIAALAQAGNSRSTAAGNACAHLLPAGGSLSGQAAHPVDPQQQQDYLDAAACMRSHGIRNFPDPTFSGGRVAFPGINKIDTQSTPFTQARQTCTKLIPAGLPYSKSKG
ncbi:MAG TPA: hypothetical protein VHT29_07545 [Solirubrobacteraceae bacterium]|nr:hypothetical protein [Solirubrobacteraceae bacterium]